jgi:plasmid stability protein
MASIKIENFPDDLYEAIRKQADRNGKSISEEVNQVLAFALDMEKLTRRRRIRRTNRTRT